MMGEQRGRRCEPSSRSCAHLLRLGRHAHEHVGEPGRLDLVVRLVIVVVVLAVVVDVRARLAAQRGGVGRQRVPQVIAVVNEEDGLVRGAADSVGDGGVCGYWRKALVGRAGEVDARSPRRRERTGGLLVPKRLLNVLPLALDVVHERHDDGPHYAVHTLRLALAAVLLHLRVDALEGRNDADRVDGGGGDGGNTEVRGEGGRGGVQVPASERSEGE